MDKLLDTIPWVFEGIGCVILALLIRFGYRKLNSKKGNSPKESYIQKTSLNKSDRNTISQTINKSEK